MSDVRERMARALCAVQCVYAEVCNAGNENPPRVVMAPQPCGDKCGSWPAHTPEADAALAVARELVLAVPEISLQMTPVILSNEEAHAYAMGYAAGLRAAPRALGGEP